jgi:hypothetical protein
MTASEVKNRFLIELDAVASGAAPGFTDAEISELLTKSQKDFIQLKIKSGEWNDIYTLLEKITTELVGGVYGSYSKAISLPTDFGYYCTSRIRISRTNPTITRSWIGCDLIDATLMNRFLSTEFNYAYFKNPVVFLADTSTAINVLLDYYTTCETGTGVDNFELTYIRIPDDVNITTSVSLSVPLAFFEPIIEMAVQEAVKSLKVAKVSTQ